MMAQLRYYDNGAYTDVQQDEALPSPVSRVGETYNGDPIIDESDGNAALPRLHLAAYRGDLNDVLMCITDGDDVHSTVVMRNQAGRLVCGITPLFLAAQRGHSKVVKLLVQHGANPGQPAYIQGSTDLCTPVSVARLNLHFLVAHYLKKAVAARKQEDKVLKQEEDVLQVQEKPVDPSRGAQHSVMANLADLSNWDPTAGEQPQLLNGQAMTVLMKHHVDLETWRPDVEISRNGDKEMMVSQSRPVDPSELEALEISDHQNKLNKFLTDADLSSWTPDDGAMHAVVPPTPTPAAPVMFKPHEQVPFGPGRNNKNRAMAANQAPSASVTVVPAADGMAPHTGMVRDMPLRPAPVKPDFSHSPSFGNHTGLALSPGNSPTSAAAKAASAQTRYSQAPRASAAAAAAAALNRSASRPKGPPPSKSTRWVAHADSSDEEEDLPVSGSVAAKPPPGVELHA